MFKFGTSLTKKAAYEILMAHRGEMNLDLRVRVTEGDDGKLHGMSGVNTHGHYDKFKNKILGDIVGEACSCVVEAEVAAGSFPSHTSIYSLISFFVDVRALEEMDFSKLTYAQVKRVFNKLECNNFSRLFNYYPEKAGALIPSHTGKKTIKAAQKACLKVMATEKFISKLVDEVAKEVYITNSYVLPSTALAEKQFKHDQEILALLKKETGLASQATTLDPFEIRYTNDFKERLIVAIFFTDAQVASLPWVFAKKIENNKTRFSDFQTILQLPKIPSDAEMEIMKGIYRPADEGPYSNLQNVYQAALNL